MRRVLLFMFALLLAVSACADGTGAPLDGAELPEVEALTEADDVADLSSTNEPLDEPGDANLAGTDDSVVEESEDADPVIAEEENPKLEPIDSTTNPSLPEPLPSTPPPGVTGEVPADLLETIIADAESRLATEAALSVLRAESVIWPDGSLGCPEPGMSYTQALVDGYWVVLNAGGQTLDYRVSARGGFKLCEGSLGIPPTLPNS